MKCSLLIAFILFICAADVQAKLVYAQCTTTSRPSHALAFSRLSEAEGDRMILEALENGIVNFLVEPSQSWVIDLDTGRVHAPDNSNDELIEKASVSSGSVRGQAKNRSTFVLNRVTGVLHITKVLEKLGPIVLNGIPIESVSTWKYHCSARSTAI